MPIEHSFYLNQQAPDIVGGIERGIRMSDLLNDRRVKREEQQKQSRLKDIVSKGTVVDESGNISYAPATLKQLATEGYVPEAAAYSAQNMQQQKNKIEFDQLKAKSDVAYLGGALQRIRENPNLWEAEVLKAKEKGIDVSHELNPDGSVKPYDPKHVDMLWKQTDQFQKHFDQQIKAADLENKKANTAKTYAEINKIKTEKFSDSSKVATGLRTERSGLPTTRATQEVAAAFNKIQEAAKKPSAAGDLSLIFSYMKILDPASTVREGEFANAQNAAGWTDQARNAYNRALKGERLNPTMREDFLSQAENLYRGQKTLQDQIDSQYVALAQKAGIDPKDVIIDFSAKPLEQKKQLTENLKDYSDEQIDALFKDLGGTVGP